MTPFPCASDPKPTFQELVPPTASGQAFLKIYIKEYTAWIDSLSSEAIYKSLIGANAAADLADI